MNDKESNSGPPRHEGMYASLRRAGIEEERLEESARFLVKLFTFLIEAHYKNQKEKLNDVTRKVQRFSEKKDKK